jgi:ribosomal-protein-alanine N-acetyltransferase
MARTNRQRTAGAGAMVMTRTRKSTKKAQWEIRWIIGKDMPEVVTIEQISFPDNPWTEDAFRKFLRRKNAIGLCCEMHGYVIGYCCYSLHKRRIEIENFAVHPEFRRFGVGKSMVDRLFDKLSIGGRRQALTTMVRETNTAAHLFLNGCGFTCRSVERNPYDDANDDGYVFVKLLDAKQNHKEKPEDYL